MIRPRIGLTTYREQAAWGVWNEPADLLPRTYADAVVAAGGAALLLPPAGTPGTPDSDALDDLVQSVLDGLHGLAVAGGADVDPVRYGAERDPHTGPARTDRDSWELALISGAIDRGLPVLAICRGMQVLNVGLGGTLQQHLPDLVGHDAHCPQVGVHGRHPVRLDPGSRIGQVLGATATVATYHHQAVDVLGADLVATGWADDGTVEAVEHTGPGYLVGVQWHPEVHDGERLFTDFVSACDRHRADACSGVL